MAENKNVHAYWWCPNCKAEVDGSRVTYQEKHDSCGHQVESIPVGLATYDELTAELDAAKKERDEVDCHQPAANYELLLCKLRGEPTNHGDCPVAAKIDELEGKDKRQGEFISLLGKSLSSHLEAIVQMYRVIADKGGAAGMQFIGDQLNNCDAVDEGDPELWQAAHDRLASAEGIVAKLHPRVLRLLSKGREFLVVGIHEPYYRQVYDLIREREQE